MILALIIILPGCLPAFSELTPAASLVPTVAPEGWALKETPETFTKETLFEHIDGQADLFIQYGFEQSVFAIYRNLKSSEDKIDVDIYDMGNSLNAFGVFSRFRSEDQPAGVGTDSYLDDRYLIFYKGRYFVILQAVEPNSAILQQLARAIDSRILDDRPPPIEIFFFPKEGLKRGSIEYYPEGLLGYEFLKRGFKATYIDQGDVQTDPKTKSEPRELNLFLAVFEDAEEAEKALTAFRDYLSEKGKVGQGPAPLGPDAFTGADPYQGKTIVARQGPYVFGAVGFESDENALRLVRELMQALEAPQPLHRGANETPSGEWDS
jgi:hypothetical protein